MRLQSTLKTAVIIALFLSCLTTYSQSPVPFISQLEGLNEGKEAKITVTEGIIGKDYTVQYRLKNTTNWIDFPVKIKKNANVGEGTVTGLETNKNYCFRVIQKDSISKAEIISNEACSIILKSTLLSEREVRLEWDKINNENFSRVSIAIMEENGSNMNINYPEKVSDTTFVYNQLFCPMKFKFNLLANFTYITNGIRKNTIVKSSQILVDPASIKTFPNLQSFGVVSVGSDNTISYNIFSVEPHDKFELYTSINGSGMMKITDMINSNVYKNTDVDTGKNYYCYANKYVNGCGNASELSGKACTMLLSSKTFSRLTWTPFIIQADEALYKKGNTEYTVQVVDASGIVMNTIGVTKDTSIVINVESLSLNLSNNKFRVLARINGELNYNSQIIPFPMFSYSNSATLNAILSNEFPKTHMTIFPNPAEDKILINSSGAPARYVELIDTKGRLIHKGEITEETYDLSAFEKGKYILRLYDANKKLLNTKTLVKW